MRCSIFCFFPFSALVYVLNRMFKFFVYIFLVRSRKYNFVDVTKQTQEWMRQHSSCNFSVNKHTFFQFFKIKFQFLHVSVNKHTFFQFLKIKFQFFQHQQCYKNVYFLSMRVTIQTIYQPSTPTKQMLFNHFQPSNIFFLSYLFLLKKQICL